MANGTVRVNKSMGAKVRDEVPTTGNHILNVTESMISRTGSAKVSVRKTAKEAAVGLATIYYHFKDREQLIAAAQASAYLKLIAPLHKFLGMAEDALTTNNREAFFSAVGDNFVMAWSYGQTQDGWKIPKLLMDVWADEETQRVFSNQMDVQIDRWISAIERARELGWIKADLDVAALVTICWSGSIGQGIFSSSKSLNYSPESIRDFIREIVETK